MEGLVHGGGTHKGQGGELGRELRRVGRVLHGRDLEIEREQEGVPREQEPSSGGGGPSRCRQRRGGS